MVGQVVGSRTVQSANIRTGAIYGEDGVLGHEKGLKAQVLGLFAERRRVHRITVEPEITATDAESSPE